MNTRMMIAAVIAVAFVAGAAVGGWYVLRDRPPAFCEISGRPIHANMYTLARVNGEKVRACCARCPLTLARQEGEKVQLLEVTDFATGQRMPADGAFFVEGSSVHMCSGPRVKRDETRTPVVELFDRCEPSLIAFSSQQEAGDFIAQNGGTLKRLDDLMREIAAPKKPAGER